jgi:branched-subunit amino acid transport protein
MAIDPVVFWTVTAILGLGTYAIRFSFLGAIGNRPLPGALRRALRYTAVAILPGLVAPAVVWPAATGGSPDPARLAAALVTLAVGVMFRSTIWAILAGGCTLFGLLWLL